MAKSIESFVKALKDEGIQSGRDEGALLVKQAEENATQIVDNAKSEAEQIVAGAKAKAEQLATQQKMELRLAARDAVLRLQQGLTESVTGFLKGQAENTFSDDEFFKQVLRETLVQYASKDSQSKGQVELNLNSEHSERLAGWIMTELAGSSAGESGPGFTVMGNLKSNGFEYTVDGATIEITPESVAEVLSCFVSERVRDILASALD